MHRVAVLDDYQSAAGRFGNWHELADCQTTFFADHLSGLDALAARLEPFEIIVAMRERTPFPDALLARLPRLRLLVTTGARNASIDTAAAAKRGIAVCGTNGLAYPTAELTWGLIIALARHIVVEDQALRAGRWQTQLGVDLNGRTLGIIGLGAIGSRVAHVARAFEMNVLAWSRNLTTARAEESGCRRAGLDDLLAQSDFVTIHMVLGEETRGLISAERLARMKKTAYLVNTSRGPLVDELALADALHGGRIAGAGLDVFADEPLAADHPLRTAPNTVLTPHIGYVSADAYALYFGGVIDNIRAYLDGRPTRSLS